jgi:hypothetical protein
VFKAIWMRAKEASCAAVAMGTGGGLGRRALSTERRAVRWGREPNLPWSGASLCRSLDYLIELRFGFFVIAV